MQSRNKGKRGVFAVLVGPDGCGKSTVTSRISAAYSQHFYGLVHFHWRPNLLPKLNPRTINTTPHDELPKESYAPVPSFLKKSVSLVRFIYYWLDFVIGYWLIIYPKLRNNYLVIGERYFLDVIVNPSRYGFFLPTRLIRAFGYLVPDADIIILLTDEPERIFKRKQELSVIQITNQLTAYNNELYGNPTARIIETTQSADNIAATIIEILVATQQALLSGNEWRAFSIASNTKFIFNRGASLRNALDLYQPYSGIGQSAKWIASRLPDYIAKIIFSRPSHEAPALVRSALEALDAARSSLNCDIESAAISFGTPGPHQKSTIQLLTSDKNKVYIKFSRSAAVKHLIENEVIVLKYLTTIPEISGLTPMLLHASSNVACSVNCQSSPMGITGHRTKSPAPQDIDFLYSIFYKDSRQITPAELEVTWGMAERLETLSKFDHAKAISELLSTAWSFTRKSFHESKILVGMCHGDYAPWNTLSCDNGQIFVYDWEYGTQNGPAMGDLFHCIFTPQILVHKHDASGITACLKQSTAPVRSPVNDLASRLNITNNEIPKYLLLYMIWQCLLRTESHTKNKTFAQSFADDRLLCAITEAIKYLISTESEEPRPRMIASAYACESDQGSEPGVGWNWVQLLSEHNEVWVYTRSNNMLSIQSGLLSSPNPYLHFEYLDLPRWASFWKRGSRGVRTYYYLWQIAAYCRARHLHAKVCFERGHHITFVNDWLWSFLALLNIPFVWGPIGSNSHSPLNLLPHMRARAQEIARLVIQQSFRWFDPLHWLTMARARTILTINSQIANSIPLKWVAGNKTLIEPAIAIEASIRREHKPRGSGKLKLLFVGKLLPIKGCHLAIEAFADFSSSHDNVQLIILGDGPERKNIDKLIDKLGILDKVVVLGWRPLNEVSKFMDDCDIFLFPTMEGAGLAVLEAMSCGLPCVCLDFGGPGTFLNQGCARLIPIGRKGMVVRGLSNALHELANDANLRHALGENARKRVNGMYSWSIKRERLKLLATTGIN